MTRKTFLMAGLGWTQTVPLHPRWILGRHGHGTCHPHDVPHGVCTLYRPHVHTTAYKLRRPVVGHDQVVKELLRSSVCIAIEWITTVFSFAPVCLLSSEKAHPRQKGNVLAIERLDTDPCSQSSIVLEEMCFARGGPHHTHVSTIQWYERGKGHSETVAFAIIGATPEPSVLVNWGVVDKVDKVGRNGRLWVEPRHRTPGVKDRYRVHDEIMKSTQVCPRTNSGCDVREDLRVAKARVTRQQNGESRG